MLIAKGVIAHVALPLALAGAGGGFLAQAAELQQRAASTYGATRADLRHALHLDWQPQTLAPRSSGEIACWQVSDDSIRDSQVATDYQGNVYVQDQKTSRLRVLRLRPGFRLNDQGGDWMSEKLADQAEPAGSLH